MAEAGCGRRSALLWMLGLIGCHREATSRVLLASDSLPPTDRPEPFGGSKGGDERAVAGVKLCWCPAGRFRMGSPPDEPERRPGEDQVEVTLTRGFWMGKYEVTQGQWRQVVGELPGALTPAGVPRGLTAPSTTSTTPRRRRSATS